MLLPSAELQFADANGVPYANGTLATYDFNTLTPKPTWTDPDNSILNNNPIVLDAQGRCIVWGEGAYRTILKDASGTQIWDEPTFTYVSDAMEPVVAAETIAQARVLLGLDDSSLAAEAAARAAADAAERAARIAADQHLQDEIDAEIAARIAADDAIRATRSGPGNLRVGLGSTTDTSGYARITFDPPFTTSVTSFVASASGQHAPQMMQCVVGVPSLSGCDVFVGMEYSYNPATGVITFIGGSSSYFYYIAVGT